MVCRFPYPRTSDRQPNEAWVNLWISQGLNIVGNMGRILIFCLWKTLKIFLSLHSITVNICSYWMDSRSVRNCTRVVVFMSQTLQISTHEMLMWFFCWSSFLLTSPLKKKTKLGGCKLTENLKTSVSEQFTPTIYLKFRRWPIKLEHFPTPFPPATDTFFSSLAFAFILRNARYFKLEARSTTGGRAK